jgi:hypothetical protein
MPDAAHYTVMYSWRSTIDAESGVLTLWPGTDDELDVYMPNFKAAFELAEAVRKVTDEAHRSGRQKLKAEIAAIAP